MTISVSLTPEAEAKLRDRAATLGQDVAAVASDLLEQAVRQPSVDELLAPFRRQVEESKLDDEHLDDFLRGVLQKVRDAGEGGPA